MSVIVLSLVTLICDLKLTFFRFSSCLARFYEIIISTRKVHLKEVWGGGGLVELDQVVRRKTCKKDSKSLSRILVSTLREEIFVRRIFPKEIFAHFREIHLKHSMREIFFREAQNF